MTQDSTVSLAERGLEYPRKQPDEPRAKNCFLALFMLCSTLAFADRELDHRKPRHLAWCRQTGQSARFVPEGPECCWRF